MINIDDLVLSGREKHPQNTIVKIKNVSFGEKKIVLIAGPCAVESKNQTESSLLPLEKVDIYRGGAYKPRTSPYSFLGLEQKGVEFLKEISKKTNKPFVTEITKISDIPYFVENVDIIQIGARDMQNFELLKELGKTNKPILLKRGFGNTIEEWLLSSEYILKEGNKNVILCERGVRSFENSERFVLDLNSIAIVKKISHLPIIVDPSHAAGKKEYVESLALAAIAAGADGLMIEVHNNPSQAKSDKEQALTPEEYNLLTKKIKSVAEAVGREI